MIRTYIVGSYRNNDNGKRKERKVGRVMRILEVLRKIGLLTKSKEELDDYYISKEIVKKYREKKG